MTLPKPEPFVNSDTHPPKSSISSGPGMIFSVSDAAALLKGVVETAFPVIKIRGELSQITRATSGHTYMTIKDAGAAISAIIWRGTNIPFKLEDGLEVIISGKFTTYPARSNYQIIVSEIEMAGMGAILKMLEERKQKLAAEGLFDAARKRPLPRFPRVIGIVTSPTGAAFQDIINRLSERFPVHVLLYPAMVQGQTAAAEITAGIEFFNNLPKFSTLPLGGVAERANARDAVGGQIYSVIPPPACLSALQPRLADSPHPSSPFGLRRDSGGINYPRPDVIIVARGGGSLEDLLPFSEEIVVRAAAASEIPLVTGVGHEPDWMLIDFAADVRAPTPTGAAEIVVPTKISVLTEIENLSHRMSRSYVARLSRDRHMLHGISLKSPRQMIMERGQRLDDIGRTMNIIFQNKLNSVRTVLVHADRLPALLSNKLAAAHQTALHAGQMLNSLSYKNVLMRGYAIVRHDNKIVSHSADFKTPAEIEFSDGVVRVGTQ